MLYKAIWLLILFAGIFFGCCRECPNPAQDEDYYLYDKVWIGDGPQESENPISVKLIYDRHAPSTHGNISGLFLAECFGDFDGKTLDWSCEYENVTCLGQAYVSLFAQVEGDHLKGTLVHDGCSRWSFKYDGVMRK